MRRWRRMLRISAVRRGSGSNERGPMSRIAGRFLTVEGIEGVGKSTQVARLSQALSERGIAHVVTREPGGTPLAERVRDIVLNSRDEALPPVAELLLMFAARAVHLANLVEPNLRAGRWVVCDRFIDATYAYQGGGRHLSVDAIRPLETLVLGSRRPDLTVLLDAPVQQALQRARQRNAGAVADRFESERTEFFERVRAVYLERAAAEPDRIAVVDAGQSVDEVAARIFDLLGARSWIS
jgi:dTMP kinase